MLNTSNLKPGTLIKSGSGKETFTFKVLQAIEITFITYVKKGRGRSANGMTKEPGYKAELLIEGKGSGYIDLTESSITEVL